jgi:phenylalanine-4-hydroxylase
MSVSVQDYARECADQGLRGDYSVCRPDFTVEQKYDYSAAEQDVWRTLCNRQTRLTQRLAHKSYLDGMSALGSAFHDVDRISGLAMAHVSRQAAQALRLGESWRCRRIAVIPAQPFFDHLANRRFPVTNWLRTRDELDYIVEPDMFHDFFGHVPVLSQPVFGDFMQMYGEKATDLIALGGDEMITRLYWYTAEYGLMQEPGQPLKAFGAGLMSSFTELQFAVESPDAHQVPFDIETVMRTTYEIDKFQRAYFVLPSFDTLKDTFQNSDLAGIIKRWKGEPPRDPATV